MFETHFSGHNKIYGAQKIGGRWRLMPLGYRPGINKFTFVKHACYVGWKFLLLLTAMLFAFFCFGACPSINLCRQSVLPPMKGQTSAHRSVVWNHEGGSLPGNNRVARGR